MQKGKVIDEASSNQRKPSGNQEDPSWLLFLLLRSVRMDQSRHNDFALLTRR